jgi:hypothetical protein
MGPYLTVPKKEKHSVDGQNSKVDITLDDFMTLFSYISYRYDMEQLACKDGEILWKILT